MTVTVLDQSLVTALGAHPEMLQSAMSAGMSGFRHCDPVGAGESITLAPVPEAVLQVPLKAPFPGLSPPHIRLLKIAAFALAELAPRLPNKALPLLLAGPERYYPQNRINAAFIRHLVDATGLPLDYPNSRYFGEGRAGGLRALAAGVEALEREEHDHVLVGGIDTFHDARTIGALKKQWRLLGDASIGGLVPGEGAGFLLLTRRDDPPMDRLMLSRPHFGFEQGHLFGQAPYSGDVLAQVLRQALKEVAAPPVALYSSENGEHHYQRELTVARLRHKAAFVPDYPVIRLAETVGDLGAAFAPVALALAASEPDSEGPLVLHASSDSGPRAVVCAGLPHHLSLKPQGA